MKNNFTYWKYHLAQGLVAGEQMGWINADFVYDQKRLDFARKLIRFRYENREFFRACRPIRPPVVETDNKFACGIGMQWQGVLREPYLCVGALENGRKKMLVAVNLSENELTETVSVSEELGIPAELLDKNRLRLTVPGESLISMTWEA